MPLPKEAAGIEDELQKHFEKLASLGLSSRELDFVKKAAAERRDLYVRACMQALVGFAVRDDAYLAGGVSVTDLRKVATLACRFVDELEVVVGNRLVSLIQDAVLDVEEHEIDEGAAE